MPGGRVKVEIWVADQVAEMQLHLARLTRADLRTYRCVARNNMGEMSRTLRLTGGAVMSPDTRHVGDV